MLSVNIICIGKLKEKYLKDACGEYLKRLMAFCKPNVIELDEYRLPDSPSPAQIEAALKDEGARILKKAQGSTVIAMCIEGGQMPSDKLAKKLIDISQTSSSVSFIIGGSFGLSDEVKSAASLRLSMSEMTFPHQLARVMLLEQIYRAFMINAGNKYHK